MPLISKSRKCFLTTECGISNVHCKSVIHDLQLCEHHFFFNVETKKRSILSVYAFLGSLNLLESGGKIITFGTTLWLDLSSFSAPSLMLPQLLYHYYDFCKHAESLQLCPTLCDSRDCCLPGSSAHGILQARILEWVAIPFSRRSSWPREWVCALNCRQIL